MATARSHRELVVWQKSMNLVEQVYALAALLPPHERYGLCDQLKRAAVSVPANIAEGSGRGSLGDYARFVGVARGSLMETETLLLLTGRLGYIAVGDLAPALALITEVSKMLVTLQDRLRRLRNCHPS